MSVLGERIRAKVRIDEATGCWRFTGHISASGYGRIGVPGTRTVVLAHRASYQEFVGPIPDGMELDHLCRVRACVNPDHLEPVTRAENIRRGHRHGSGPTEPGRCWRGHAYTPENTYVMPTGQRSCRECRRIAGRKHDRKRRTGGVRRSARANY